MFWFCGGFETQKPKNLRDSATLCFLGFGPVSKPKNLKTSAQGERIGFLVSRRFRNQRTKNNNLFVFLAPRPPTMKRETRLLHFPPTLFMLLQLGARSAGSLPCFVGSVGGVRNAGFLVLRRFRNQKTKKTKVRRVLWFFGLPGVSKPKNRKQKKTYIWQQKFGFLVFCRFRNRKT